MSRLFKKGDRVNTWGRDGVVLEDQEGLGLFVMLPAEGESVLAADCTLLDPEPPGLMDEVQDLINMLVATGHDNKRRLARQVATLMRESKGALTRGDKLQAAAMLIVSAGLASDANPEKDDG